MKKIAVNTAILLPPVFILFFVYKYGITVPYCDQWELVPLLEKMHNHTLALADLWNPHNGHRLLFPKILMLLLARWSNWNIFLELCTNIVLAIFIFLFLLSILRNTLQIIPSWLKIFISMVIFSMGQYENWSCGWQIQIFLSVLGSVIAIWAANKWQGKTIGLVIAISAAVLSSYSFNSGLVTWPAVLVVMLMQNKWKLKHIVILILACIATVLLYYYNYTTNNPELPSMLFFLSHPIIYIRYVLTYLGASIARSRSFAPILALILFALSLLAIFDIRRFDRQKLRDLAPWFALALYACMAACVTGLGRAGYGWQQASSSRYAMVSVLFPISAAVFLVQSTRINIAMNKNGGLRNPFLTGTLIVIFVLSYIHGYNKELKSIKELSKKTNATAFYLNHPELADEQSLKFLHPDPNLIKLRSQVLSELGIKFKEVK
jgi:MFS family permease